MKYLMALDVGTGGGRCFICDIDGRQVAMTHKTWPYIRPKEYPGALEFDSKMWWDISCDLIKRALHEGKISSSDIAGIGITSFRQGLVMLDRSGEEIHSAPNADMRATDESIELQREFGKEIYQITGKHPFPHFAICRLLWLSRHMQELYKKIDKMLLIGPWLLYKLTGEKVVEPSLASDTALFDVHKVDWSRKL